MSKRGRPTKYQGDATIQAAYAYLDSCQDTYMTDKEGNRGDISQVDLPSVTGFARTLGVTHSTVKKWATEYPKFSATLDEIKDEQYEKLKNSSLSGHYNSKIAKLMLTSNHGMTDRKQTDVTSGGQKIGALLDSMEDDE